MLNKSECLRLKGICEPLEDIIVRHYGEDWKTKADGLLNSKNRGQLLDLKFKELEYLDNEKYNLVMLSYLLNKLTEVESKNWNALLHKNDKLDTGE